MIRVKLILIVMLLGVSGSYAHVWSQTNRMSVKTENVNLVKFFGILQQKTDLRFVFNHEDVQNYNVTVDTNDKTLSELLDIALSGKPLKYEITSNHVIISRALAKTPTTQQPQTPAMVTISGTVRDKMTNTPMSGVTVSDKDNPIAVATDANGRYSLNVPKRDRITLTFQFMGMQTVEMIWKGRSPMDVLMEEDLKAIDQVVVTGFFERKAESFTGSASTFTRAQLRSVSASNVLESLRTLDPSISYLANDMYGSDPNKLPDISIRGKTSIVDPRETLATDPNQPLYILDGFAVSAAQVMNLNLNRIQSVTILKDAASTAIYGAQAANGVIVIETVKPRLGKLRVEYSGAFSAQFADLSDYNLMNAREKLEVEVASGVYKDRSSQAEYGLSTLYNKRLESVMSGVDTYWLKVPTRTGFTQRHNINVGGGDQTVLYGIGFTYADTKGVMKGSGNDDIQFNVNLQYRTGKFQFSNNFTLENHQTENPPVAFSEYANTSPYYRIPSDNSRFLEDYRYKTTQDLEALPVRVTNPLYNASLKFIDESRSLILTENLYAEWRPVDGLKITGRAQVELRRGKTEFFKSPYHTDYARTDYTQTTSNERGRYEKGTNESNKFSGNITANYYKTFAGVHQVFANATASVESTNIFTDRYAVVGFSDDIIPYPSFAGQYEPFTVPGYSRLTSRRANFFLQTGYVYNNRYSFDFTVREDGTSNYGQGKLFSTFWSAGAAWSLHREKFLLGKLELLKLRFSIGKLGNDNAKYATETVYRYYTQPNIFGSGLHIGQFGNYWLDWEKTLDMNVGLDFATNNRSFSMRVDVYKKTTDPLILNLDTPASTGRDDMKTNLGSNINKGINFDLFWNFLNKPEERITWGIGVSGRCESAEYSNMGNLSKLNDEFRNIASLRRVANGASMYDIWAVRSAGIDPGSGEEVYIKKDGTYTFTYDSNDEVVVGNSQPLVDGRIRTSLQYKGFSLGLYLNYRYGEDYMNTILQNRIEGLDNRDVLIYNQDKRALYDRWKAPGDQAQFKRITDLRDNNTNRSTDRFLQQSNWLAGESISIGYSFDTQSWLKKANIENISVQAVMNDLFHWSTVKIERGITYPYARTATFSVSITF